MSVLDPLIQRRASDEARRVRWMGLHSEVDALWQIQVYFTVSLKPVHLPADDRIVVVLNEMTNDVSTLIESVDRASGVVCDGRPQEESSAGVEERRFRVFRRRYLLQG